MRTSAKKKILRADLQPILAKYVGIRAFRSALRRAASQEALVRTIGRYIHFNSVFAAGVANLVGAIAVRQDLFKDGAKTPLLIADRSAEIASHIFATIIDEFGGCLPRRHGTHRSLAQAVLNAAGRFFGWSPAQLSRVMTLNEGTLAAIGRVAAGYGINQSIDEDKLFTAIGFHLGSERLADEEFRLLDEFLHSKQPALIRYMQKKTAMPRYRDDAYLWVRLHASIEADHFSLALKAANSALQLYAGPRRSSGIKGLILSGFDEFARVQSEFIKHLVDD